ncbi:MAG: biotin carboxylase N-terminal domain-containing protein [Bdellovibrionota bacterium]
MSERKIGTVLVANRGEIAVRIIRAAREYGLQTVAIYSDADEGALHVRLADKRVALGGNSARDSYLSQDKILNAAILSGADAVHPGYGFFAENAEFARALERAGLTFIGPDPAVIGLMGDKDQARRKAAESGVPVVPGTEAGLSPDALQKFCKKIGYPVMIKAVAGGSGRGMRLVEKEAELGDKLLEAQAEAEAAFRNRDVIVEKYLGRPRHIEVQVFGDAHGNVLHFGERECSLQRRHQKVVEESPAAFFHPAVRARMLESAVALAKAVGYRGAGTMEFLVEDGTTAESPFYFLEMNTRIQVEHAVTEAVTGIDLLKLQFHVAEGKPLPMEQSAVQSRGHAIEFRVYAEDPSQGFKPTSGTVRYISRLGGAGLREDAWVEAGTQVSAYYDSLLSKLTVWGASREEAIRRSVAVLGELVVEGMETTLGFHRWVVRQPAFRDGPLDVKWIEREYRGELVSAIGVGPLVLPPLRESKS